VFCGSGVELYVFFDLLDGQRTRRLVALQRDSAGRDDRVVARFPKGVAFCDTPEGPELEINERSVCVYCVRDLQGDPDSMEDVREEGKKVRANRLPSGDLLVVPDARDVGISACLRGNERSLGDGESAGDAGALLVIFEAERTGDVLLVGTGSLHRSQDDSVL